MQHIINNIIELKFLPINSDYSTCSLKYTDSTSKVNLATYITGLAGTTQGTGQVVNEKAIDMKEKIQITTYGSIMNTGESSECLIVHHMVKVEKLG